MTDPKELERKLLDKLNAPDEAMDAYPDECANCGAKPSRMFVPNDYHELPHHKRDPGICTQCGHHFGTGRE